MPPPAIQPVVPVTEHRELNTPDPNHIAGGDTEFAAGYRPVVTIQSSRLVKVGDAGFVLHDMRHEHTCGCMHLVAQDMQDACTAPIRPGISPGTRAREQQTSSRMIRRLH